MNSSHVSGIHRALALATLSLAAPLVLAQAPATPAAAPAAAATPPATSTPAASAPAAPAAPAVADEASSYSVGLVLGNQLHGAGVAENLDFDALVRGLKDGVGGKAMAPEDREHAMQLVRSGRDNLANRNHAAAKDFLAQNGKQPGVITTASGLQYQVIEAGDEKAASPASGDRVTVHYRGRLIDGTEFDNSDAHAQAATFNVNAVIKGWHEALLLMKPKAKWRLFVPPELAYDLNSPPNIAPGSLLIFDVELLKVEPTPVMAPQPPKAPKSTKPAAAKPAAKPATKP